MLAWILKIFPGGWMLYAGIAAAAFTLGGTAAWNWQGNKLAVVTTQYKAFVDTTKTQGEAAIKLAKAKEDQDKLNKQKADDENKLTIANFTTTIKRLRDARTSSSYVPASASVAASPNRACFSRGELESAIRTFDQEIQGFVDEGSTAVIDLDTAKHWAQEH